MGKLLDIVKQRHEQQMQQIQPETYEHKVARLIKQKYSINDELAILRQQETKPTEWQEYNDYCEECKIIAKIVE